MMIKAKVHKTFNYMEVEIKHPLEEIESVLMYVIELPQCNSYLFSIPFHHWSCILTENQKVNLIVPGSFRYEGYKEELINIMMSGIQMLKNG